MMSTSARRRRCASAATGRWLKKAGSATKKGSPRHMEAGELETSVRYCVASLAMLLAAVFVLSQLFQVTCVLSRALSSLEAIVVPHGQRSVLVPVCDKDEVTVHSSLSCQKYSFLGQR